MIKKIKKKIKDLREAISKNYAELLFLFGILLILIAMFKIHVNLGLVITGALNIFAGIILYIANKEDLKKD